MTGKQAKTIARIKLKGNWGNCLAITFAMSALLLMLGLSELVFREALDISIEKGLASRGIMELPAVIVLRVARAGIYFVLMSMIHYIIVKQFADISAGMDLVGSRNAVYGDLKRFFKVSVIPNVLKYLILFGCVLPGFFAYDMAKRLAQRAYNEKMSFLLLLFFMLSVLMIIFSVILVVTSLLTLHLLPVLMTLNPELPAKSAIVLCYKLADGQRLRMLALYISFLKYLPFCLLIYPLFLIIPYFTMSDLILQYDILGEYFSEDKFFQSFSCQRQDN